MTTLQRQGIIFRTRYNDEIMKTLKKINKERLKQRKFPLSKNEFIEEAVKDKLSTV